MSRAARPGGPPGPPGDLPGGQPFAALDPELPLLLLPVRVETRYQLAADPPQLRIRIMPDQVHIDSDTPAPGAAETELTTRFWREWYAASGDVDAARHVAWQAYVRRVGARRAGYLARLLAPQVGSDGNLRFPAPGDLGPARPARPVLLPQQWLAIGYSAGGALLFSQASRPVAASLRTAPDPHAPPWQGAPDGLIVDKGLAWMIDYDLAAEAGMAITVALTGPAAAARSEVDTLLVVGLYRADDPVDTARRLDDLIGVHARTVGAAFVPAGTPTNNTDQVSSGWSRQDGDVAALAGRELGPPPPAVTDDNAGRLAGALGLPHADTLRRLAFGTDQERARSRAMTRLTFEAVLGTFARKLLRVGDLDGVLPATVDALRAWCVSHVTGGAPYPCLRIGPQPYGMLPVQRSAAGPATRRRDTAGHVAAVVDLLAGTWRQAAATVPTVNPDETSARSDADTATVLAMQPNPDRLLVRRLDSYAGLNAIEQMLTPQWVYNTLILGGIDPANPNLTSPYAEIGEMWRQATAGRLIETIGEQTDIWQSIRDDVGGYLSDRGLSQLTGQAIDWLDPVLSMLSGYQQRQQPLQDLGLDLFEGVLGQANTALVEGVLWSSTWEWGPAGLVEFAAAAPGETAADYLADLRARFARRGDTLPPSTLPAGFLSRPPLLYQLLDRTLALVPADAAEDGAVSAALDLLAVQSASELERLLRECLGLGMHRLDAWHTALATQRLNQLRQARPAGLQIGAFGWARNLKPRPARSASEGFIHAPSMAQAATAAVLRSGWSAGAQPGDADSPLAVDLSSARIRAAAWLLDGVRAGQDLGDLLGYRFERALHDAGADAQIAIVRQRVLAASGTPDDPPDQPVDGIALLDLDRAGRLGTLAPAARTALDQVASAFDAVNDAGLVEAVHQLLLGNHARASAMLDALAGEQPPPSLTAPRTARSSTPVEHRVVILLDPGAEPSGRGWAAGVRDRIAPGLETWVASVLPPATSVGLMVHCAAGTVTPTLADLGLSALDALFLVGADPAAVSAPLLTLAAGFAVRSLGSAAGPVTIDPRERAGVVTLAEFGLAATELRRAISGLRAGDARDLRPAQSGGDPDADEGPALAAAAALVTDFEALVQRAVSGTPDQSTLEELARYGVAVTAPPPDAATGAAGQPGAVPSAVQAAAQHRLEQARAVIVDPGRPGPGARSRLAAILGAPLPLLAQFRLSSATGGDVVDLRTAVASADAVDEWLDAVARTRPGVGQLVTAGLLAELLDPAGGLCAAAGQVPMLPGDAWVAAALPSSDTRGRLNVVTIVGPQGPPAVGDLVSALVVDTWSERIPRKHQMTGVALHFDAPSNRPPQAWLLATVPDGESWSLTLVLDTLRETLDWAALRSVGPEDIGAYGRAAPSVFVPGAFIDSPQAGQGG